MSLLMFLLGVFLFSLVSSSQREWWDQSLFFLYDLLGACSISPCMPCHCRSPDNQMVKVEAHHLVGVLHVLKL